MGDHVKLVESDPDAIESQESREAESRENKEGRVVEITLTFPKLLAVAELVVGLILVLTFSILIDDAWSRNRAYFVLGLFIGLYLVADFMFRCLSGNLFKPVEVKVGDKSYKVNGKSSHMRAIFDCIFAVSMIVAFILIYRFTFGSVLGIILGVCLLIRVAVARAGNVNTSLGSLDSNNTAEQINTIVQQLSDDAGELKKGFLAVNDNAEAAAVMKSKRVLNFSCIFLVQCLCVLVVVAELFLINWDDCTFAFSQMESGIGYARLDLRYISWISCAVLFILTSPVMAGIFKPSWLANAAISMLTFGIGIYFALMSSVSVVSIAFLKKMDNWEVIYRCLQLLPIPGIAVLLIVFGLSTGMANFRLEASSAGLPRRIFTNLIWLVITIIFSASAGISQIWAKVYLEDKWNVSRSYYCEKDNDRSGQTLDWWTADTVKLYLGIQVGVACAGMIISLLCIFSGPRKLPGLCKWFCSVIWFGLSVAAAWNINYELKSDKFDISENVLIINCTVAGVGLLFGGLGMFVYSPAVLYALVWFVRVWRVLFLTLGFLALRVQHDIVRGQKRFLEKNAGKETTEDKNLGKVGEVTAINELQ